MNKDAEKVAEIIRPLLHSDWYPQDAHDEVSQRVAHQIVVALDEPQEQKLDPPPRIDNAYIAFVNRHSGYDEPQVKFPTPDSKEYQELRNAIKDILRLDVSVAEEPFTTLDNGLPHGYMREEDVEVLSGLVLALLEGKE